MFYSHPYVKEVFFRKESLLIIINKDWTSQTTTNQCPITVPLTRSHTIIRVGGSCSAVSGEFQAPLGITVISITDTNGKHCYSGHSECYSLQFIRRNKWESMPFWYDKFSFCKNVVKCTTVHLKLKEVCLNRECDSRKCNKRHPRSKIEELKSRLL